MIYERPVYFYEMDQMRIVHHANYIHYLEEARLHAMQELGFGYDRLIAMGLASPVMGLEMTYLHPASYPDVLAISVLLCEYDGVRFTFSYAIRHRDTGVLLARGETRHCLIASSGLPVRVRTKYPELHALMLRWLEESREDAKAEDV